MRCAPTRSRVTLPRGADRDAALLDLHLIGFDRGRRGAVEQATVLEVEDGAMPRARYGFALDLALVERAAEVRADRADRVDPILVLQQHHGNTLDLDALRRAGLELALVQDRGPLR